MAKVLAFNNKLLSDGSGHVFKHDMGNTGTKNITENGTHDVDGYKYANVNVSGGVVPSGTLNITANGNYDVTNYASANVAIETIQRSIIIGTNNPAATFTASKSGSSTVTGIRVGDLIKFNLPSTNYTGTWTITGNDGSTVKTLSINVTSSSNDYYGYLLIFSAPSSHTPGDTITWDNKSWLVCHYDSSANRVYLISSGIIDYVEFGDTNYYAGSTLAQVAMDYQTYRMSAAALEMCVNVTVPHDMEPYEDYDVTAKVFVPSYDQMNGGFSWFNSNDHRKVDGGVEIYSSVYWTSSVGNTSTVSLVTFDGTFDHTNPDFPLGFRPCVCVQL